jgi:hypothetical protein
MIFLGFAAGIAGGMHGQTPPANVVGCHADQPVQRTPIASKDSRITR